MILRNLSRSSLIIPSLHPHPVPFIHFNLTSQPHQQLPSAKPHPRPLLHRTFASRSSADERVEELQELYATARDEFEIASEETDKKTVYAADDRAAAREELTRFKEAYEVAVREVGGEQIKSRIGARVRELERAVEAMEERAMED